MNGELTEWLDNAVLGLPLEIQGLIRNELKDHYNDAADKYRQIGKTPDDSHKLAMSDLGNPSLTAQALRKVHLAPRQHILGLAAMGISCLWILINDGSVFPNFVALSGATRITTSMVIFLFYLYGFWMLRKLFVQKLRLNSLKLPIGLQLLGWSLQLLPVGINVLLIRISSINGFVFVNYPAASDIYFYTIQILNSGGLVLVGVGVLLMMYHLVKLQWPLYRLRSVLIFISIAYGFAVTFKAVMTAANTFGVLLPPRWQIALHTFSQTAWFAMLLVVCLIFWRAYRHDAKWSHAE
jgi:hypothetical protein